jgi:hypothetical protein
VTYTVAALALLVLFWVVRMMQPKAPPGVDVDAHKQEAKELREADKKLAADRKTGTLAWVNRRFGGKP